MQVDSIFKVANSIIIDGINDKITSTSGHINFDNINLEKINKITADSINIGNMNVSGTTTLNKIRTRRIVSPDSLIYFGDSSLIYNENTNNIYWSPGVPSSIRGFKLGNGVSYAMGLNSIALGYKTGTWTIAENSITIGSGSSTGDILSNKIPNSLFIGFNSNRPTLFVGPSSGPGTTGKVGIGTTDPQQKLHIYKPLPPLPVKPDPVGLRIEREACGYWDILVDTGSLYFTNIPMDPCIHPQLTITKYGKVGIGTSNPQRTFHVHGDILISGHEGSIYFGNEDQEQYLDNGEWAIEFAPAYQGNQSGLNFWKPQGSHYLNGDEYDYGDIDVMNYKLFISDDGNVGIGTGRPDYKLTVNGKIICEDEVLVVGDINTYDYVLQKGYKLKTLKEVENYIKENHHLQDIPSAEEMKKNGLKLAEMSTLFLKKIEELTLYIIELDKQNQELKLKISELENKIK